MNGVELFLGGAAALAVLSVTAKAKTSVRRARAAAEIARVCTSPVSLVGRVLTAALVIVGAEWLVISHSENVTLRWAVLGFPALVTSYTLVKALTVVQINPSGRRSGGRR